MSDALDRGGWVVGGWIVEGMWVRGQPSETFSLG